MGQLRREITEQPPWFEAISQQVIFSALTLVAIAIPVFAVSRLSVRAIHNVGLATGAALGSISALGGLVVWTLRNNTSHAKNEAAISPPEPLVEYVETLPDPLKRDAELKRLNDERVRRLRKHVDTLNRTASVLCLLPGVWVLAHL